MSQDRRRRQALIRDVRNRLTITKVVCTKNIKTRSGDTYVGMSASFAADWESTQDDNALDMAEPTEEDGHNTSNMSVEEARIAALLLGVQVDRLAYERALANGEMSEGQFKDKVDAMERNYATLLLEETKPSKT